MEFKRLTPVSKIEPSLEHDPAPIKSLVFKNRYGAFFHSLKSFFQHLDAGIFHYGQPMHHIVMPHIGHD